MAIAAVQGFASRPQISSCRPFIQCYRKIRQSSSVAVNEKLVESTSVVREVFKLPTASFSKGNGDCTPKEWKKISSIELGITTPMITKPARFVLDVLRKKGYKVYLVGGCVRDLLLKRTPKDFDIITSAELREVKRAFHRCEIVGRRFPICHVYVDDIIVEVSSFSTSRKKFGRNSNDNFQRPPGCNQWDFTRWRNCMQRDFTINGLMFDPFADIIYDYTGGIEDIQKAKVRSVTPASTSFMEDCARILRGVRIAARLGFRFTKETSHFVKVLSNSLLTLDKGRILMELNYMLAYGSAEASLRLLWKFGLLEILLPIQASYFVSLGFRRRDTRSNLLLSLFSKLDKLLAPDRPCNCCLWVSILAFHEALADQPRGSSVIAAFCIAMHGGGGSLSEAVDIAMKISQPHDTSFHEIFQPVNHISKDALMDEVMELAASIKSALHRMTDAHFVSQALIEYPQAPQSDLDRGSRTLDLQIRRNQFAHENLFRKVFISWALSEKVCSIFDCVRRGKYRRFDRKLDNEIDYESLAIGRVEDVRNVFARVVFDTVYPPNLTRDSQF